MELTLRRQKILFLSFYVSGTLTTSWWPEKLRGSIFWKEEDLRAKEASKRRPEGRKKVAHAATIAGRVGPILLGLGAPQPSILSQPPSSWPKNAYKKVPWRFPNQASSYHRNTKTDIWGCRLEGENSGGALPGWSPPSPTTSPPSPWWRGSSPPSGLWVYGGNLCISPLLSFTN